MQRSSLKFDFQIKSTMEMDDNFIFEGLASTFTKDLDKDRIEKGAFRKSLEEQLPVILFQHDHKEPIGMASEAYENNEGLFIKAKLPKDDDLVRGRVMPQMRIGSIKSMSIGFTTTRNDIEYKDDTRVIKKLNLHEVSLVTFPANPEARVMNFKSELSDVMQIKNKRQFEEYLRELGVSQKGSVYLSSKVEFADKSQKELISKIDQIIGRIQHV